MADSLVDTPKSDGINYHELKYRVSRNVKKIIDGVETSVTEEVEIIENWIVYNEGTADEYIKRMEV